VPRRHSTPIRRTRATSCSKGHLTIKAGDERFELGRGGTALVPIGLPHTFRVDSEGARVLVLSTPAGLERLVARRLGARNGRNVTAAGRASAGDQ